MPGRLLQMIAYGIEDQYISTEDTPWIEQVSKRQRRLNRQPIYYTSFGRIENPQYSACPITCKDFEEADKVIVIKSCGHLFDADALRTWLKTSPTCPLCRCDCQKMKCLKRRSYNYNHGFNAYNWVGIARCIFKITFV